MLDDNMDKALEMVNNNNGYYKIGEYIISRFNVNMNINMAKEFGKRLILQYGYKKEQILNGEADEIIEFELDSKINKSKEIINIPLKTTKTRNTKKVVVGAIASLLAVTTIYSFGIKPAYNEMKENDEIKKSIGMMAAEVGSEDYENKRNIVSQNTYKVGLDDRHYPIVAYHNDGIAKDIIQVCTKEPELFELCMYNVYFDMNYNRLKNMDEVVRYLKNYTEKDESLAFIQNKLSNCNVFLDYLITNGFANPNAKDYYQLLESIKEYKNLSSFSALSEESQKRIEDLIDEYEKNKDNLYDNYKNNLEQDEVNYGTRS